MEKCKRKVIGMNMGWSPVTHMWDGSYELKLDCGHSVWDWGIKKKPETYICPKCLQENWLNRLFSRKK